MNIALCDDEREENESLQSQIESYAIQKDYDIHCKAFTSGSALLKEPRFDLYILDYWMDEMNGVDLAQALKEQFGQAVTVCFLTNYESAASEIINHRVYADGFLRKPVTPDALHQKIDFFYQSSLLNRLELKKGSRYETVFAQDVLFIEADGKRSKFHFKDRTEDYNYLLSKLEELLTPGRQFLRVHRSYIVNLQHVQSYDAKSVTMVDGSVLPLRSRTFKDAYRDFLFRLNR